MAEFQEVMRQWARMCNSVPGKNEYLNLCSDKKSGYICPMKDCGLCNKSVSNQTDDDRLIGERIIMSWAAEHPEPVYPTWGEWFIEKGILPDGYYHATNDLCLLNILEKAMQTQISADTAQKLGLKPKEQEA